VMFHLTRNISLEILDVRRADRECTVTALPLKCHELRRFGLHPFRRLAFDLPNQIGKRDRFPEPAQDVYMILNTTGDERWRFETLTRTGEVGMGLSAQDRVFNWTAPFCLSRMAQVTPIEGVTPPPTLCGWSA